MSDRTRNAWEILTYQHTFTTHVHGEPPKTHTYTMCSKYPNFALVLLALAEYGDRTGEWADAKALQDMTGLGAGKITSGLKEFREYAGGNSFRLRFAKVGNRIKYTITE